MEDLSEMLGRRVILVWTVAQSVWRLSNMWTFGFWHTTEVAAAAIALEGSWC